MVHAELVENYKTYHPYLPNFAEILQGMLLNPNLDIRRQFSRPGWVERHFE
jgi:hypothetical protein